MLWLAVLYASVALAVAQEEDACGILQESGTSGGFIESPGFAAAAKYKPNTKCRYHLGVAAGQNIALKVDPLSAFEGSENACKDYIVVYKTDRKGAICDSNNYEGTRIAGPICSYTAAWNDIIVPGSGAVVEFCTDASIHMRGFHVSYAATTRPPVAECKHQFTLPLNTSTQAILSPQYPNAYPTGASCSWELTAPASTSLQVDTASLFLNLASAKQDYINILEPTGDGSLRLIGSFNEMTGPSKVRSHGNKMTIYFSSFPGPALSNVYKFNLTVSVRQCSGRRTACPNDPLGDDCAFEPSMICDGKNDCPRGADESICSDRCGKATSQPVLSESPKIIYGQTAVPNSWPWQVVMNLGGNFICGGSIIHSRFILTAAHCCTYRTFGLNTWPSSEVSVDVGVHNRGSVPGSQRYRIQRVIAHPQYQDSPYPMNDFCLLQTTAPISIDNNTILPVCMPTVGEEVPAGSTCYITGWGETGQRDQKSFSAPAFRSLAKATSNTLQQIDVGIITQQDCQDDYQGTAIIGPEAICAQGYGDSCQGDSGGPMVCSSPQDPYRFQLRGVVSWAFGCADELYAGVNARVSHVLPWIIGEIGKIL